MKFITLKKVLIVGGIILVFGLLIWYSNIVEKQGASQLSALMQSGEFAIGEVRVSRVAAGKFLPYSFYSGGERIASTWYKPSNKYLLGKSFIYLWLHDSNKDGNFLVIYDPADPKDKSLVRLDCPIKDSSDFRRYVQTITDMRAKGEATIGNLIPGGISE